MVYTFEDYKKEVFERNPKAKELYEEEWLKYIIAERIKKTREFKGISQLELAKMANTTQSVVARIEAGNQNLSLNTLHKFLKILGLELKIEESKK
ncbi:MAG: helix-turn-helix transcriptional regulator [Candidatus Gracilibacteria bacterium]|nr:helix-turn-helix transcriptional regulator [Candidatus Gracilibacteria bacterium]